MAQAPTDPNVRKIRAYIAEYEKDAQPWHDDSDKIVKRYKDERTDAQNKKPRFNVLWSNVETLKPFLYSSTPKPVASTRHDNADETARTAAEVLERALVYTIAEGHFGSALRNGRDDYLLAGRGTGWVRYKPTIVANAVQISESEVSDDPAQLSVPVGEDEDGTDAVEEVVGWEETIADYVHWRDFGHNIAPTWEEVDIVWRAVPMDRDALIKRFGEEIGKAVPLDWRIKGGARQEEETNERARVYECWWKSKKKVFFVSKCYPGPLDEVEDPLQLDHFWPCPKPIYATLTTDTLIPTPDFKQYRDQANEIDDLTARIASLTQSIKVAGVYDSSFEALATILNEGHDNVLIPVDAWAAQAEKGGIQGAISFLPIQEIVETLLALHTARDNQKADLYEITGMSDIIRGNTNPEETLGAQQIKVNFASKRLAERQAEVERFAANMIAIMGNIIAVHFSTETLIAMTGMKLLTNEQKAAIQQEMLAAQAPAPTPPPGQSPDQPPVAPPQAPAPAAPPAPGAPPQMGHNGGPSLDDETMEALNKPSWEDVIALLRNEPQRRFSISVESDSLVAADDQAEQQQRTQFLQAVGQFLQSAMQAAESQPAMVPLLGAMLMFAVRGFRIGRDLDEQFQEFVDKMEKQAAEPQPPKPDPAMAKVQADSQLAQAQAQHDQQMAAQRFQFEQQQAQTKAQSDMQIAREKMQIEDQRLRDLAQQQIEADLEKARLDARLKIAVAEITAKTVATPAQASAATAIADGDAPPPAAAPAAAPAQVPA